MSDSRWRDRCRPIIVAALAALPPDATREQAERAVRPFYPFGPREHHPYAMWRKEVKAQLDARFAAARPDVWLAIDGVRCRPCHAIHGEPGWLYRECLCCAADRARWRGLTHELQKEWIGLAASFVTGQRDAAGPLADWSEEHMGGLPFGGVKP